VTYLKVSTSSPIRFGSQKALKPTMNGICNRQTCSAYADPISILPISFESCFGQGGQTHLSAMFPFMANDMAFMNSVVLGMRVKRVNPRNFSSTATPSRTTSTTSTRISTRQLHPFRSNQMKINIPAIMANKTVHPSNTPVLTPLVQLGDSCPPPSCSSSSVAALIFAARGLCPEAF